MLFVFFFLYSVYDPGFICFFFLYSVYDPGFILARVVRVKNENGRKFTRKK